MRELANSNLLVLRTLALLNAAILVGSQFVIENPADHGDVNLPGFIPGSDHAPLWLLPAVLEFETRAGASKVTFAQCQYGAPYQKYTTLMYSPGLSTQFGPLANLLCTHTSHGQLAGGLKSADGWNSKATAAYPPDLCLMLAKSLASLGSVTPPADPNPLRAVRAPLALTNELAKRGIDMGLDVSSHGHAAIARPTSPPPPQAEANPRSRTPMPAAITPLDRHISDGIISPVATQARHATHEGVIGSLFTAPPTSGHGPVPSAPRLSITLDALPRTAHSVPTHTPPTGDASTAGAVLEPTTPSITSASSLRLICAIAGSEGFVARQWPVVFAQLGPLPSDASVELYRAPPPAD